MNECSRNENTSSEVPAEEEEFVRDWEIGEAASDDGK
jgi:hypothetical protein